MRKDHVHHLLILGDQKLALRWVPWAKSKLKDLQRYDPGFDGQSFGKRKYQHTIGTEASVIIEIKMVNKQKWILIWARSAPGLYMESGILDFLNVAPLNEDTYLPAKLHYSSDIDSIRGPGAALGKLEIKEISDNKLKGENRAEGDSKALGCKEKEESITVSNGEIARTFSAATPTYCPNLYFFKNVQDFMPPSMFSGKLRMMVQAIYGSKRRDYFIDASIPSTTPLYIEHDGFTPWFSNNASLFSASNYEYFYIRISTDGKIYARKLFPSAAGKKLRRYLINNPGVPSDRKIQYEAYLLSTLTFDSDHKSVEIGETGPYYQKGGPFGYGPAWNWKGDTGYVVVKRRKSGTTNVWQSTMLKLSVSENPSVEDLEDGKLSASVSIYEDTQDFTFRVNQDLIWEPDHLNTGMKLFVTQGDAFDVPTHVECDVPIKVVANYANDTFDVVRFKREDLDSTMGGFNANVSDSQDVVGRTGCGDQGCDLWASATGAIEVGFYIENISGSKYEFFEAVGKDGDSVDFNSAEVVRVSLDDLGALSGNSTNPPDECGEQPAGTEEGSLRFVPATGGSLSGDGDFDRQGMLVVPYYDCDAVYIATGGNFDGNLSTATVKNGRATGGWLFYDDEGNQLGGMTRSPITWANTDPTGPADSNSVAWNAGCDTGSQDCNLESASGDVIIGDTRVEHFCNGAFTEAFSKNFVNDAAFVDALYMPSCLGTIPFGDETGQGWEEGDGSDAGGWSTLFNPVVFPIPEVGPSVISKSTANFHAFRATKTPGGGDPTIDDGSYDFAATTLDADKFAFSIVGFA